MGVRFHVATKVPFLVAISTQFEQLDQPALHSLPSSPYVFAEWKTVRVHIDYHVSRLQNSRGIGTGRSPQLSW